MGHVIHIPHGFDDPNLWVWVGLLLFILLIFRQGVPGMAARSLDARAQKISEDLEEARRMREEAQELLASYQRRQRDAEQEAEEIIARARADARQFGEDARRELAQRLERRAEMAERKISQAEADALAMVRGHAADLAATAAEQLLRDSFDQAVQNNLVAAGLEEMSTKMSGN